MYKGHHQKGIGDTSIGNCSDNAIWEGKFFDTHGLIAEKKPVFPLKQVSKLGGMGGGDHAYNRQVPASTNPSILKPVWCSG